jgi:hypothetical protein
MASRSGSNGARLTQSPRSATFHVCRRDDFTASNFTLKELLFWLAAICCATAQFGIVRSALRATEHDGALHGDLRGSDRRAEMAWALIPAVALVIVLTLTWRVIHTGGAS